MIATMITHLASVATIAASDGGAPGWLLALGPAGAGATYFGLWSYYRNTGKSHSFERETRIAAKPITGDDTKVDEVKGTKRRRIDGGNEGEHRQRVQRF